MAGETHLQQLLQERDRLQRRLAKISDDLPKAAEQDRLEAEANGRAEGLLRAAGPEGARLADGELVLVPSPRFPTLTYALTAGAIDRILVLIDRLGLAGNICIQPKEKAPVADAALTRLMLIKGDEKTLWTTGRFWRNDDYGPVFLPKQIQAWLEEG